jgi:hypothetical protein
MDLPSRRRCPQRTPTIRLGRVLVGGDTEILDGALFASLETGTLCVAVKLVMAVAAVNR